MIDECKELTVTMASNADITDMLKYHISRKAFEPQTVGDKTTEKCKSFCPRAITIVN